MRKWAVCGWWLLCSGLWAMDINHASEAELDGLLGVGPAFTRRLMAERSRGPFASWDDLMRRVSGMGRITAQKLSDQGLTVNEKALSAEKNSYQLKP